MNRNDKKVFYDQYNDGTRDYYTMSYQEIEDAVGENEALEIWNNAESLDYNQIVQSYLFD